MKWNVTQPNQRLVDEQPQPIAVSSTSQEKVFFSKLNPPIGLWSRLLWFGEQDEDWGPVYQVGLAGDW